MVQSKGQTIKLAQSKSLKSEIITVPTAENDKTLGYSKNHYENMENVA